MGVKELLSVCQKIYVHCWIIFYFEYGSTQSSHRQIRSRCPVVWPSLYFWVSEVRIFLCIAQHSSYKRIKNLYPANWNSWQPLSWNKYQSRFILWSSFWSPVKYRSISQNLKEINLQRQKKRVPSLYFGKATARSRVHSQMKSWGNTFQHRVQQRSYLRSLLLQILSSF